MHGSPIHDRRDIEMKLTTKLGAAGATLGLGTFGLVAALSGGPVSAQTPAHSASPAAQAPAPSANTGNAQVDSQTAPDTPGAGEAPEAADSSESTAASETATPSDGSGGHQDPAGNVDHQSSGNE
jgi:hypothetical protein